MKRLKRILNPAPVHMGQHGNEMCDHFTPLTDDCFECEVIEPSERKLTRINLTINASMTCVAIVSIAIVLAAWLGH